MYIGQDFNYLLYEYVFQVIKKSLNLHINLIQSYIIKIFLIKIMLLVDFG